MKRRKSLLLTFIIALPLIGSGVVQAKQAMLGKQDKKFINKAASGGMFEVKMGQVAQSHSSNDDVKAFGQRMIQDHSKANQELMNTVQTQGLTMPTAMDKKDRRAYDKLSKLNGTKFDRKYMKNMVKDHEKAIDEFKKEAKSGKNAALKEFAEKTTPMLEEHLRLAKKTLAEIEK